MTIIDISWPIRPGMTAYKDKKVVTFEHTKTFEADAVRESVIRLGSHSGTHVDAPAHFLGSGRTTDAVDLTAYNGPCKVLDMTHVAEYIGIDELAECSINEHDIIVFKTANSALHDDQLFNPNFVYLAASGARYLAERKIKAVGIDYLGIERNQPEHETHTLLMHNNIAIIEGLRLSHVHAGTYELLCLPLAVVGLEAAPARAVLMVR